MLMVARSGSLVTGTQEVDALQQLVVFQTPPPTDARYATMLPFVVVVGSTTMSFTRPAVVV
jgi:hypothetical protein